MKNCLVVIACLLLSPAGLCAQELAASVDVRTPRHNQQQVLASAAGEADWRYLAFPALLDCGDEVLVSYKRGRAHAYDPGASLEMLRISSAGQATLPQTLARLEGQIMQMGEWVRFPNGEIANFIDTQSKANGTTRLGLHVVRSTDGGKTFGALQRVGLLDGVEYGYAFDFLVHGQTTWMLAMRFANLRGGKPVFSKRPHAGSVDVIRSDDNGQTWQLVRDLSHEFGDVPINESAFIRHGDGFLVSTRGYDDRQRLHLTDASFRLVRQNDLTAAHAFLASHIGRPRLFSRDAQLYLLGRNWTPAPRVMQLCLFRLDPVTLRVTSYAVLDNAEKAQVADGYYAMPYFRGSGADTRLFIVDYKGLKGQHPPEIIRHEYRWDEVK